MVVAGRVIEEFLVANVMLQLNAQLDTQEQIALHEHTHAFRFPPLVTDLLSAAANESALCCGVEPCLAGSLEASLLALRPGVSELSTSNDRSEALAFVYFPHEPDLVWRLSLRLRAHGKEINVTDPQANTLVFFKASSQARLQLVGDLRCPARGCVIVGTIV